MHIYNKAVLAILSLLLCATGWSADHAAGQDAYNSGDYQAALTEWQPLAEEGYADAQFGLGLMYANGFGVSLDDTLALKWYGMAADQGHAKAQCNLAVFHANGWGVPQSDEEALKWYILAAEAGITEAQISVAKRYSKGLGTEQDRVAAYKWFLIASILGDYGAAEKRDQVAEKLTAPELAESAVLANVWMENHQNILATND